MSWQEKIREWYKNRLLSAAQKQAIETYEERQKISFWPLGVMWLGIFILSLGVAVLGKGYMPFMSLWSKIGAIGILIFGGIGSAAYACYRKKHLLYESALFFTFLMLGCGIGLIAQLFDMPVVSGWGLFLWAIISFIIVLLSEHEFLSLLWLPLFLGGVLGYWHLELLLLFFADDPIITVCIGAGILFGLVWLTGTSQKTFIRAVHRWTVILFYLILIVGEYSISHSLLSGFITIGFLSLMVWYAIRFRQKSLFNLTLLLIVFRTVCLCLEFLHFPSGAGWGVITCGMALIVCIVVYQRITDRPANKR